jgi:hypothetical protein
MTTGTDIRAQLRELQDMTARELKCRWAEVFGEQAPNGHKQYLIKRIAWRIQANAEGDLSHLQSSVEAPADCQADRALRFETRDQAACDSNIYKPDARYLSEMTAEERQDEGKNYEVRLLRDLRASVRSIDSKVEEILDELKDHLSARGDDENSWHPRDLYDEGCDLY